MQVKIFSIRLHDNLTEIDQNSLNDFLETVDFKKSSVQFVEVENPFWSVVVHFEDKNTVVKDTTNSFTNEVAKENRKTVSDLNINDERIFNNLKTWRNEKATEIGLAPFIICHNAHLIEIAVSKPTCTDDLKLIKGFGDLKAAKYGDDIIALLNAV